MEYTKDMILQVRYGEVNHGLKSKKKSWTSKILKRVRTHKFITTAILSAIVFISIDVVLITNFIQILSLM